MNPGPRRRRLHAVPQGPRPDGGRAAEHTAGRFRSTRARRAAVGLASVMALVFLQLLVVGAIVTGVRDQDMTVQRLNALQSQYSADSVLEMALREVCQGADEDGDGTIGSVAAGVVANGPSVNGARAAAGLAVSGQNYTITAKGTNGSCSRAILTSLVAASTPLNPIAAYAASAAPAVPVVRQYSSGAWDSGTNLPALTADVCWQLLRSSPVNTDSPTRALVALNQSGALTASIYRSGAWGAASTLTTGTGTPNTRVFAAEFEGRSGNLMVVYRKSSNSALYYRSYSVANPAEQSFSIGLGAAPTWMEFAAKPGGNELVLVAASGSSLRAAVWDGISWGNSTSLSSSLPTSGRPFHVAYMNRSGSAIVVWTGTTGAPKYALWDGSSWSTPGSLPGIGGGAPANWIKLEGSPLRSSDDVLMACIGTNNQISVNNWTGSAWGSNLVVETATDCSTQPQADISYQPDGAKALIVWHAATQSALRSRTWSSGGWSAQQTGPDMTTQAQAIHLVRGYGGTEVMMLVRRPSVNDFTYYNAWSNANSYALGTVGITGPIGSSAGSILPTPPAATANSNNISPSGGTVAPGTYGAMTQSGTVTFTAGTYVFSSVTVSGTLIFDTSGGPIVWNITTGGLSGVNNNTFTNIGNPAVRINVLQGDIDLKNNSGFTNIDFIVYDGNITLKNNTSGSVGLYASGTISIDNDGAITPNPLHFGSVPACSAVLWTGGVAGARTDLSTSCSYAGLTEPCDLSGSPMPQSPSIDSWASVAP